MSGHEFSPAYGCRDACFVCGELRQSHPCPDCGGVVQLVSWPDGFMVERIPSKLRTGGRDSWRPRLWPFLACSSCEYCAEVGRPDIPHV